MLVKTTGFETTGGFYTYKVREIRFIFLLFFKTICLVVESWVNVTPFVRASKYKESLELGQNFNVLMNLLAIKVPLTNA